MSNTNIPSIEMDEHRFKKLSKKLQKKINEKSSTDIKLNVIQESLSEALGFRNLHDLKGSEKNQSLASHSNNIFDELMFTDNMEDNFYICRYMLQAHPKNKSENLSVAECTFTLFEIFYLCSHNKNIPTFSLDEMKDVSILKKIAAYDSFDFPVAEKILKYIRFSRTDRDVYNLDEYFAHILEGKFKELEYRVKFETLYNQNYKRMLYFIETLKDFKDNYNMAIYKKSWFETERYTKPQPRNIIKCSEFYYKSWLHMSDYLNIIGYLDYLNSRETLTITGLILHAKRSISPELKTHIFNFLEVILANYKQCAEVSKELVKLPF